MFITDPRCKFRRKSVSGFGDERRVRVQRHTRQLIMSAVHVSPLFVYCDSFSRLGFSLVITRNSDRSMNERKCVMKPELAERKKNGEPLSTTAEVSSATGYMRGEQVKGNLEF